MKFRKIVSGLAFLITATALARLFYFPGTPRKRNFPSLVVNRRMKEQEIFDVTLVTHSSLDKMFMLEEVLTRWKQHVSVAVACKKDENKSSLHALWDSIEHPDKVQISTVTLPATALGATQYPINYLRNMAIAQVQTTHYVTLDIDLLPSEELYATIMALPTKYLSDPKLAVVVPAMQMGNSDKCRDSAQCFSRFRGVTPRTKTQLLACMQSQQCSAFYSHRALETHSSTDTARWLGYEHPIPYSIRCFQSVRYEPYVVLQRGRDAPRYNEAFTGYGKNKIEYINHLRFSGYKFRVLPKGFVIHMPHAQSLDKSRWLSRKTGHKQSMDRLFVEFKQWLEDSYPPPSTALCQDSNTANAYL